MTELFLGIIAGFGLGVLISRSRHTGRIEAIWGGDFDIWE